MQSKTEMIDKADALPGRTEPMPVPPENVELHTSMTPPFPSGTETIYFAMGCFWGAERIYWQIPGVYTTAVGYMGGWTPNPTYEETCTARTGHTETVMVVFDPNKVPLDQLLKAFWENHDPTTPNRQGGDIGTQYRSAIFTTTDAQLAEVELSFVRYQQALTAAGYGTITTQVSPASEAGDGQFYYAEDYHQQYLYKHPGGYCNHGFCQIGYSQDSHGQKGLTPDND